MGTDTETRDPRLIGALLHGLEILDMYGPDRRTVGVTDMARELGVHKSTASRLAATLAHAGYLKSGSVAGTYSLGSRVSSLAGGLNDESTLKDSLEPALRWLAWRTGETAHLAIREGARVRSLAIVDGWHTVRMHSWVGKLTPAQSTSTGKAMLADLTASEVESIFDGVDMRPNTPTSITTVEDLLIDLDDVRARGYGLDDEEIELGLRCVSAPIFGPQGRVVAAISVSGPSNRISKELSADYANIVRWAAQNASAEIGGSPDRSRWPATLRQEPDALPYVEAARAANSEAHYVGKLG